MTGVGARALRAMPFTATYAGLVVCLSIVESALDRDARTEVVRAASTNLSNLGSGHVETLLVSAVIQAEPALPLLLPVVAALALAELVLGWRRTLAAFVVGHVGATLVVAGALAVGALPGVVAAKVRDAVDTGPSYGTAAVIGAGLLVATMRALKRRGHHRALRATATGLALIAAVVVTAVTLVEQPTFTSWGHLVALLVGAAVGAVLLHFEPTARVPA